MVAVADTLWCQLNNDDFAIFDVSSCKREFSLIAKGTPGRREVDARLHSIVVCGIADGFAAAVLLTLAVVVTALRRVFR